MPIFSNDPELLRAFTAGNRAALERVYWEYVAKIERIMRFGFVSADSVRVGGVGETGPELRDLVQEVFTKALSPEARRTYDGLRPYGPYVFAIARNVLADWQRRSGREVPTDGTSLEASLEAMPPAVDDVHAYADQGTVDIVERFVRGLPADLRALHEHRFVRGLSQRDAAAALGLSRQNVRTIEEKLRTMLRDTLADEERRPRPAALNPSSPGGA
jgi:RNA polymerase sigma factor (sigma-70 family)